MDKDLAQLDNGEHTAAQYRTRWLLAHNRLHAVAHEGRPAVEEWDGYLEELKTADEVADRSA